MKKVTVEDVKEWAKKYKDSDNINPMLNEWICAYTDPQDPTRHCIAGQFLADNKLRLPGISSIKPINAFTSDGALGDWDVRELLCKLQIKADNVIVDEFAGGRSHPIPWKEAIRAVFPELYEEAA